MTQECETGSPPSPSLIKSSTFLPYKEKLEVSLPLSPPQEQQDRFPGSVFPAHSQLTLMDSQGCANTLKLFSLPKIP